MSNPHHNPNYTIATGDHVVLQTALGLQLSQLGQRIRLRKRWAKLDGPPVVGAAYGTKFEMAIATNTTDTKPTDKGGEVAAAAAAAATTTTTTTHKHTTTYKRQRIKGGQAKNKKCFIRLVRSQPSSHKHRTHILASKAPPPEAATVSTAAAAVQPSDNVCAAADDGVIAPLACDTNNPAFVPKENNAQLIDAPMNSAQHAQTLPLADIAAMHQRADLSAEQVIHIVTQNSKTFQSKTAFSKEKYIARKKQKFEHDFTVLRPTTDHVARAWHDFNPKKACAFRADSLSLMLTSADVGGHGKATLVVDTYGGPLLGAVARAQGGHGHVIYLHPRGGSGNPMPVFDAYGLSQQEGANVVACSFVEARQVMDTFTIKNDTEREEHMRDLLQATLIPVGGSVRGLNMQEQGQKPQRQEEHDTLSAQQHDRKARQRLRKQKKVTALSLLSNRVDSILIASKYDPQQMFMQLFPLLASGGLFAVHCQFVEPLVQCARHLKLEGLCVDVAVRESWLREYQVLPNRTHPMMNMNASGGYVMTGIKLNR